MAPIPLVLAALLAQAPAEAFAAAPPGERDFRHYVFAAYGAAILLLLVFNLWALTQLKAAEKKLDHLREKLGTAP